MEDNETSTKPKKKRKQESKPKSKPKSKVKSKPKPKQKPKSKKKRKRPDVAARMESNKDKQFVCVKTSLNQFLSPKIKFGDASLRDIICKFVYKINIIKRLSYDLINYEMTYRLENNLELPEINQNLFYNACCAVSFKYDTWKEENRRETESIFHHQFPSEYMVSRERMGENMINHLNKQQFTMTENHLKLNFYKRFTTYLSLITGETRKYQLYKWFKIISDQEDTDAKPSKEPPKEYWTDGRPKIKNPLMQKMKEWLKVPPTESNIQNNMSHFIKVYYKILKTFEKYPSMKRIRTFNLLPTSNGYVMRGFADSA